MRIDNPTGFTSNLTGSFTGSFFGDGSGLTGTNSGSWDGDFTGSAEITGSLRITGSLSLSGSFKDQESSTGTAGQVLSSTVSGSQWVDAADSSAITGAGTTGTITKWTTGGSVIGDSIITEAASAITVSGAVTSKDLNVVDAYANDPLIKLAANTSGNAEVQIRTATTTYNPGIGIVTSGYDFNLFTANTSRLTITSGGIITVGSQPAPPWISGRDIIQLGDRGNINAINSSGNIYINNNIYVLANGNNASVKAGGASQIRLSDNDILFYTSNVASAANEVITLTPKLTITSTGLTQINSTNTTALELITNQSASSLRLKNTGSIVSDWIMQSGGITAGDLAFYNLDTSAYRLTISSGGNVGIGIAPSPQNLIAGSLDLNGGASIFGYDKRAYLASNVYYQGGWKVKEAGYGAFMLVGLTNGDFGFYTTTEGATDDAAVTDSRSLHIASDGVVSIPNGIIFNNNTTGGIPNATGVTLNDYEEGTFTVSLISSGGGANLTPSNTTGYYTRVGNKVTVQYYSGTISVTAIGSGAGVVSGLPFTSSSTVYHTLTLTHVNCYAALAQNGFVNPGTSQFYAVQSNTSATMAWNSSSARYFMLGGTYLI